MINLNETEYFGINEEEDYVGSFFVNETLNERDGSFNTKKGGSRIDIKEVSGNEPHIHLRDEAGNICRVRLRTNEYQRDSYEKNDSTKAHKLDKDEEKAFREYMHSNVPNLKLTQWERLCADWNTTWAMNNSGTGGLIGQNVVCPSYNKIQEPKK